MSSSPVSPTMVSPELFRKCCSKFATGIAIATVLSKEGEPHGLTINSFTSVSACPPLVLVCIDYRCAFLHHFRSSAHFGVNILAADQEDLSVRFSQRPSDRFRDTPWTRGVSGVPLLSGCLASLECASSQVVESGDHAIFIGEVERALYHEGAPLLYYDRSYRRIES